MSEEKTTPSRFVGLDVHKYYLIAAGVDAELNLVWGPQRVPLTQLDTWMGKCLTLQDAVVLEMTTNAFQLYDDLQPQVGSVSLVHPPHVALITHAQVMTDKIAALTLARLHAAGLLPTVWVPPQAVRDQRALIASRSKMVRLATQAKNRLQAVLHRHHLLPSAGNPFAVAQRDWWLGLPVTPSERVRIQSDLDTLAFIRRFPTPEQLVGYAGLGGRVHDSGLTHRAGGIPKAGRRDSRAAMVEAAHIASRFQLHWKAELARLEPRLGYNKAIVAIARKLLVAVWHVLSEAVADRFAEPEYIARKLLQYAYRLGRDNRPADQSPAEYVRQQLDRLGVGADLTTVGWGQTKTVPLPPTRQRRHETPHHAEAGSIVGGNERVTLSLKGKTLALDLSVH